MKRRFGGTVIAMVLCFILTVVSVYADDGKGQNPDYVTVTVNDDFVDSDAFDKTELKDGDAVEFLYFMGGGAF